MRDTVRAEVALQGRGEGGSSVGGQPRAGAQNRGSALLMPGD